MTLFVTLLGDQDKEAALKSKIVMGLGVDVFHVDPDRFTKIPGSPFAYWAAPRFVELFDELDQFASDDRAAVTGMQTNDNGRWARLLWEGEAERGGLQQVSTPDNNCTDHRVKTVPVGLKKKPRSEAGFQHVRRSGWSVAEAGLPDMLAGLI